MTGLEPPPAADAPWTSVVVVNWNGRDVVDGCLASLLAQSYRPLEIIVVDNGSTDGSRELIRARYGDRVALIENAANLGFAGGNNVGIRRARGEFVALLNNDATADPAWIEELVRAARADERIGMCASRVYLTDPAGVLDTAGLLISFDGIARGRGRLEPDGDEFRRACEVFVPSGAAALYRRAMLDEVGLFDEAFFAYCDDTDLGFRGRLMGWTCVYVPAAVAFHRYSTSTAPYSPFKAFQIERNRVWVVVKYYPLPLVAASLVYSLARLGLQACAALRRRGAAGRLAESLSAGEIVRLLAGAWAAAARRLPGMWRERRRLRKLRRVGDAEIRAWLRAYRLPLADVALKD